VYMVQDTRYKTKRCANFHSNYYCLYGQKCRFAHHESHKVVKVTHKMRLESEEVRCVFADSGKRLKIFEALGGQPQGHSEPQQIECK
jgi:hypothetical protein